MLNTDDFTFRLQTILDYYGLTASSFADKIGVQRSSLSHLLSGRNKPSLEFVLKISDVFKEVDLYWLLLGKGNFPKTNQTVNPIEIQGNRVNELFTASIDENQKIEEEKIDTIKNDFQQEEHVFDSISKSIESVEKIVVFYKNGTFKSYLPK